MDYVRSSLTTARQLAVDKKLMVHLLVIVFAVSSWVSLNGMWVELPVLVTQLPEQWTLPSYVTVLSQTANVGPVIFLLVGYLLARKTVVPKLTLDKVTAYVIMLVGLASTLLLMFLWKVTGDVAGSERSVALLSLSTVLALMDCTSSVAYVAFMAALRPVYLSSFFIGEGLSGLLPALLALAQGAGDIVCVNGSSTQETKVNGIVTNVTSFSLYPQYLSPRFSVEVFFVFLCIMVAASLLAFFLLNNLRYCTTEFVPTSTSSQPGGSSASHDSEGMSNPIFFMNTQQNGVDKSVELSATASGCGHESSQPNSPRGSANVVSDQSLISVTGSGVGWKGVGGSGEGVGSPRGKEVPLVTRLLLLGQVVVINFLITSFLLSVQTYSSLPYGLSTYNLVVTLVVIVNPVACLSSMFLVVSSPLAISALTSLGCACSVYIIVAASMSPDPPLVNHSSGRALVVVEWVAASFFLTYAKVSVAGVMRHVGRRALLWYGVATQCGALIGAVTGFVLVNVRKVFHDAPWC